MLSFWRSYRSRTFLLHLLCLFIFVLCDECEALDTTEQTTLLVLDKQPTLSSDQQEQQHLLRGLQRRASETNRGRTVLTFLYLSVLGLCFTTPVLYYCRLNCEERAAHRRLREMEVQGLEAALSQSADGNGGAGVNSSTEESRALRTKYIEERRARIVQLFAPVQVVLTKDHFPDTTVGRRRIEKVTQSDRRAPSEERKDVEEAGKDDAIAISHKNSDQTTSTTTDKSEALFDEAADDGDDDDDEDMEHLQIEIPIPGLHVYLPPSEKPPTRLASGTCSICLCAFEIGSDIVWSSNEACDHVFHEECIEKWLMKQREGPLCPCCRRDFILDPFDVMDEEEGNNDGNPAVLEEDDIVVEPPPESAPPLPTTPTVAATTTQRNGSSNNNNNNNNNRATEYDNGVALSSLRH